MSGYTEEMQLFLAEPDNKYYARLLLPEIADVLDVSVSQLEGRPIDVQILLAKTYVNGWQSDRESLKQALKANIYVNDDTHNTQEIQKKEKKGRTKSIDEMERMR